MISWCKAFMRTRAHPNNTGPIGDPLWTTGDPWEPVRDPSAPTKANLGSIGAHQELFLALGMQTGSTRDLQGEPCDFNLIQKKMTFSKELHFRRTSNTRRIIVFISLSFLSSKTTRSGKLAAPMKIQHFHADGEQKQSYATDFRRQPLYLIYEREAGSEP